MIPILRDDAEASAFTFCGGTDCGDNFEHLAEDTNCWMAANNVNALDRYRQSDICVVLDVLFRVGFKQQQFVFRVVPSQICGTDFASDEAVKTGWTTAAANRKTAKLTVLDRKFLLISGCDLERCVPNGERNQGEVFLGVTQLIHGPEDVIPSLVSVAAPKKRDDFFGQILAASGYFGSPMRLIFSEGKGDVFDGFTSGRHRAGVATMIERGPEIVNGIEYDARQIGWKPPAEFDLVQFMQSVSIVINDVGPWLFINEGEDLPFQVVDVMLCPT